MREIKFRVWDRIDKKMIIDEQEFIPFKITNKGILRLNPYHKENLYNIIPFGNRFELMQYTRTKR